MAATKKAGITTTPRMPRGHHHLGLHQLGTGTAQPQAMGMHRQAQGLLLTGQGLQGTLDLSGRRHQLHGALVVLCHLRVALPARRPGLPRRRPDIITQCLRRVSGRRGMLGGLICLHRPGMAARHLMGLHQGALPQAGRKAKANVTELPWSSSATSRAEQLLLWSASLQP